MFLTGSFSKQPFYRGFCRQSNRLLWVMAVLGLVFSANGCKTSSLEFDLVGAWEFQVSFHQNTNLNLPRTWVFTFTRTGDVFLFSQMKGSYTLSGDRLQFDCRYADRYRNTEYAFFFAGQIESDTSLLGRVYNNTAGPAEVGTFRAEKIAGLQTFDVVGTWDFDVTYIVDYYQTQIPLPHLWKFTFKANGELWLDDQRKQTYDFDGRNVRFPCHYYFEPATGSAVHLLFLGFMTGADNMDGFLYNDVGGSWIIGIISARRR